MSHRENPYAVRTHRVHDEVREPSQEEPPGLIEICWPPLGISLDAVEHAIVFGEKVLPRPRAATRIPVARVLGLSRGGWVYDQRAGFGGSDAMIRRASARVSPFTVPSSSSLARRAISSVFSLESDYSAPASDSDLTIEASTRISIDEGRARTTRNRTVHSAS